MGLVTIGEFARLSRLSPKALRLYDQLDVLAPAQVDGASGYRWYETGQLERAGLVAALRQIGVPLAQVRELLELDPAKAADQVVAFWSAPRPTTRPGGSWPPAWSAGWTPARPAATRSPPGRCPSAP
jgi:DNA-binding transcriptional MerR regulator